MPESLPPCPTCGKAAMRHTHDTAYGMHETHMVGTERFVCTVCGFTVFPEDAREFPAFRFVLDRPPERP